MTDTKHSAELATCDFCRAEVPVRRKYLYRENKEREIGDGFTITRYCHECGLKSENADTNHTDSVEAIILEASNRLARFEYEPAKWHNMMVYEASDLEGFLDWLRATLQAQTSQQVEAITHAIMTAVHEQEERDDTVYPKIRTHTLAGIIKSLVPTFSYHGYIKKMTAQQVEEEVRKGRERCARIVSDKIIDLRDSDGNKFDCYEQVLKALTPNHQD